METKIIEDFKKYRQLMQTLSSLYFKYLSLLRRIEVRFDREQVLNEKISDKEMSEIEQDVLDLELTIEDVIRELNEHIRYMKDNLAKENVALTELAVTETNSRHVDAMEYYNNCFYRLDSLKARHPDYDFSKIDFSVLESKKRELNIAIQRYNDNNLRLMNYKLISVKEAQVEAENRLMNLIRKHS